MANANHKVQQVLIELKDVNKERRRTAVMKLGMLGGDEALKALIRTVENHYEDLIVRGRAAMMLGKIGDTRAVEPLIRALDAPGFQTPFYAAEALGKIGDTRAIEPLLLLANNTNDKTQNMALQSLQKLGYFTSDETELVPEKD